MKKRIYVHIGAPKTGTTSIQSWLANNRDTLNNFDVLYPASLLSGTFRYFLLTEVLEGKMDVAWQSVIKEIAESKYSTILLSSEALWYVFSATAFPREKVGLIQDWLSGHSVTIIVYLRNPGDWCISRFKQKIKGRIKWHKSFQEFIENNVTNENLYSEGLKVWADIFGRDAVSVSVYDQVKQEGKLIEHFLSQLGIKGVNCRNLDWENLALSTKTLKALRMCNKLERNIPPLGYVSSAGKKIINKLRNLIIRHNEHPTICFVTKLISKFDKQNLISEKDLQNLHSKVNRWPDELADNGWISDKQANFLRTSQKGIHKGCEKK